MQPIADLLKRFVKSFGLLHFVLVHKPVVGSVQDYILQQALLQTNEVRLNLC